jgi:hypothetical protein
VINSVQYHKLKKMINLVHNANAVTSWKYLFPDA